MSLHGCVAKPDARSLTGIERRNSGHREDQLVSGCRGYVHAEVVARVSPSERQLGVPRPEMGGESIWRGSTGRREIGSFVKVVLLRCVRSAACAWHQCQHAQENVPRSPPTCPSTAKRAATVLHRPRVLGSPRHTSVSENGQRFVPVKVICAAKTERTHVRMQTLLRVRRDRYATLPPPRTHSRVGQHGGAPAQAAEQCACAPCEYWCRFARWNQRLHHSLC